MTVTRDDVARVAGVSVATVSYVLNKGPKAVSAEKRERVLAAVAELGYRPNAIARSLRARRTSILGLVVPDSANPYFARLSRAVEDAAAERGFQVVVCNAAEDTAREASQIEALLRLQVDGLIWVPADVGDEGRGSEGWGAEGKEGGGALPDLAHVPTVQVDRALSERVGLTTDVIESDNALGGRLAAEHLLKLGHRRIGFISGPPAHRHTVDRLRGAREALASQGVEPLVAHGDFGYRSGYELARKWCGPSREGRPTAIMCANDAMAFGVLCAAALMGVRVPEELSVTGYDDIPQARFTVPPLTTVAQPVEAMAREALDRLLRRVDRAALAARSGAQSGPEQNGEAEGPVTRVHPVKLVVRASTGACLPESRRSL
ncbi:MAG TPA: LacI family DNA-binding transcriptional regulator [Chloroflexota bacterium]|nr:LacI family DNA-binding transcriptional regulator [Chloroflexota bacterium]